MESLLVSTGVVALAEIGDKTQLLAFILAARFKKPLPIILGILVATLVNHGLAGALGAWITSALSPQVLRWVLGLSFIGMAVWTLIPDKIEEEETQVAQRLGVFGATLVTFFLAEMGDKTQIATVALAAPIFDIEGQPVGALCVRSRAERMDLPQAHSLAPALIGAARRISHNAGGQFTSIEPNDAPPEATALEVRCVVESRALLGEGPVWSPRDSALYWVDILTPAIHRLDGPSGQDAEFKLGSMVSVTLPKASGGLLAATPSGLMAFDTDSRRLTLLCHPESDRPGNRYNDGKCDRLGRFWVGTLDMATAANRGNLFRVEADGAWKKMDSGFTVANGLGWSPDNRAMYFTDSHRRTVYRYDFDLRAGTISNRQPLIVMDATDGRPDGLTVDEEGCLWVAVWDAWRVSRYSPEGRELMRIKLPVPRPTSCCFGGPNLDTLYITSASVRLSGAALEAAPLSGSLLAVQVPGVRGLPETLFAG